MSEIREYRFRRSLPPVGRPGAGPAGLLAEMAASRADVVVCLVADADTLRQRLATRRTNEFGKAPGDVEAVMSWVGVFEHRHKALGAVMVDAMQPLPVVAAAELAAASAAS